MSRIMLPWNRKRVDNYEDLMWHAIAYVLYISLKRTIRPFYRALNLVDTKGVLLCLVRLCPRMQDQLPRTLQTDQRRSKTSASFQSKQAQQTISQCHGLYSETSPLWALIIGINDYPQESGMPELTGAVSDADAVNDYLQSQLKVPRQQIQNLRNGQATRGAILAALESLRDNSKIQPNDPILFYFAGNGGETPNDEMQAIIPVDYIPGKFPPIRDLLLATLFYRIALQRGPSGNIVRSFHSLKCRR